jgi:hypothetical protein
MQSVGAVTACQLLTGNASVGGAVAVVFATVDWDVAAEVGAGAGVWGGAVAATFGGDVFAVPEESDELWEQPAIARPSIAMTIATARLTSTSRRRSKLSSW